MMKNNPNLNTILKQLAQVEKLLLREDIYRARKLVQSVKKLVIKEINQPTNVKKTN